MTTESERDLLEANITIRNLTEERDRLAAKLNDRECEVDGLVAERDEAQGRANHLNNVRESLLTRVAELTSLVENREKLGMASASEAQRWKARADKAEKDRDYWLGSYYAERALLSCHRELGDEERDKLAAELASARADRDSVETRLMESCARNKPLTDEKWAANRRADALAAEVARLREALGEAGKIAKNWLLTHEDRVIFIRRSIDDAIAPAPADKVVGRDVTTGRPIREWRPGMAVNPGDLAVPAPAVAPKSACTCRNSRGYTLSASSCPVHAPVPAADKCACGGSGVDPTFARNGWYPRRCPDCAGTGKAGGR